VVPRIPNVATGVSTFMLPVLATLPATKVNVLQVEEGRVGLPGRVVDELFDLLPFKSRFAPGGMIAEPAPDQIRSAGLLLFSRASHLSGRLTVNKMAHFGLLNRFNIS
jgi:hypothetical protein